jgi:hypothetical protein
MMQMYIASEDQGFDTSTACIRRVFRQCIELGRQARREGNEEKEFESFRLLGTGLHTLEDFSAHSKPCAIRRFDVKYQLLLTVFFQTIQAIGASWLCKSLVTSKSLRT